MYWSFELNFKEISITILNLKKLLAVFLIMHYLVALINCLFQWDWSCYATSFLFKQKWLHPSPALFLLVFDQVLGSLPADISFKFINLIINHLAYADDPVLIGQSASDLQHLLNLVYNSLAQVGLEINIYKSVCFTWIKDRKLRKIIFDDSSKLYIKGNMLRNLAVNKEFTYLGASFSPLVFLKLILLLFRKKNKGFGQRTSKTSAKSMYFKELPNPRILPKKGESWDLSAAFL